MKQVVMPQPMGLQKLLHFALGLVFTAFLVNAAGIRQWAERLEIGDPYVPRQALVEMTGAWEEAVEYTGLNGLRRSALGYRHALVQVQKMDEPVPTSKPDHLPPSMAVTSASDRLSPLKSDPKLPLSPKGLTAESHIALVGDSLMAVGLAPNLIKMIERNALGKVVRAYKSGTGLARPDVFNWITEYPKMLGGRTPAIVICAIGANDGQGIQVDKKPLQFGTPAWEEEYAKRVGEFLALLLEADAKVYWVLLPRMRNPVYDKRTQNLNAFLQAKFKHVKNLKFITPDAMIAGGPVTTYVEYALIDGKQSERLRAEDGIHLTDSGARRLAASLLNAIE